MISVSNLHIGFGKKAAIAGIDMTVERGECLLLAGANGSGKTTLLRAITGVLRTRPGEIAVDDIGVGPVTQQKIAYIPASLSFYDSLKLKDAVLLHGSFYHEFSYKGIGDYTFDMNQKTGSLSRGEKTLFYLSLALSTSPDYLLIDDVLHYLDPYLREIFLETMVQLMEEKQLAVIIAAQSAVDIEGVLERVVLLDKGKIAVDRSVEQLKRQVVRYYWGQADEQEQQKPLPVIYRRDWGEMKELYLYPYSKDLELKGRTEYLNLTEIIRAFIGGEYGTA